MASRILDVCLLICAALLICALCVALFVFTEARRFSPMWVFLPAMAAAFIGAIGWNYRKEFGSARFAIFFCAWLLIHLAVFVFVVDSFGWPYWFPAVIVELFLFYVTAYLLFGLLPPSRSRRKARSIDQ